PHARVVELGIRHEELVEAVPLLRVDDVAVLVEELVDLDDVLRVHGSGSRSAWSGRVDGSGGGLASRDEAVRERQPDGAAGTPVLLSGRGGDGGAGGVQPRGGV